MAGASAIEWTGHTWNPLAGCSVLSPGCKKCYAMRLAKRLGAMGNPLYKGLTQDSSAGAVWTGEIRKAPRDTLLEPLRRKKPTTWFVNSMSDLFHEDVPDAWIDEIFAVMALSPQHTFQVLTKRAERMRSYLTERGDPDKTAALRWALAICRTPEFVRGCRGETPLPTRVWQWASEGLPNVWLGVSTERQPEADERIPHLLNTPAAVRFISAEPLLGALDISNYLVMTARTNWDSYLDWVIVGGESGHGHRDMDPAWAKSLLDQCAASGVHAFMKQMAGKKPIPVELFVREMPEHRAS